MPTLSLAFCTNLDVISAILFPNPLATFISLSSKGLSASVLLFY